VIQSKDFEARYDLITKYRAYKQTRVHQQQVFNQTVIERLSEQNNESESSTVVVGDLLSENKPAEQKPISYPRLNLYAGNEVEESTIRNSSFLANNASVSNI